MNGPLPLLSDIDSYVARTGSPRRIYRDGFFDVDTWVSVKHRRAFWCSTSTDGYCDTKPIEVEQVDFMKGFSVVHSSLQQGDYRRRCFYTRFEFETWLCRLPCSFRTMESVLGALKECPVNVTEADYPTYSETCAECAENGNCNNFCRNNYMVDTSHVDNTPYIGWYLPYAYLKQEQAYHPDDGPSVWVNQVVADGSLLSVTQNAVTWLYGWEAEEIDADLLAEWTQAFEQSGYDYTTLVKALLVDEVYGRRQ